MPLEPVTQKEVELGIVTPLEPLLRVEYSMPSWLAAATLLVASAILAPTRFSSRLPLQGLTLGDVTCTLATLQSAVTRFLRLTVFLCAA